MSNGLDCLSGRHCFCQVDYAGQLQCCHCPAQAPPGEVLAHPVRHDDPVIVGTRRTTKEVTFTVFADITVRIAWITPTGEVITETVHQAPDAGR